MKPEIFVIAEAGVNHNGDRATAMELIDVASQCGADAVKFQTFYANDLAAQHIPQAAYQRQNMGKMGTQADLLRSLELPLHVWPELAKHAAYRGIEFMSTAFDVASLDFLIRKAHLQRIKIPSGEITNLPLLVQSARRGLPLIVSTGMSELGEVADALDAIAFGMLTQDEPQNSASIRGYSASDQGRIALAESVVLLQCTTSYPTPPDAVNLRAMTTMQESFKIPVGFSDHSEGFAMSLAAVGRGATVIEKHFTLSRDQPGPDHVASLEPAELEEFVRLIRVVSAGLGDGVKAPTTSELEMAPLIRRVLVAARPIRKGQVLGFKDLQAKRAGAGLSPATIWEVVGTAATSDFEVDDVFHLRPE